MGKNEHTTPDLHDISAMFVDVFNFFLFLVGISLTKHAFEYSSSSLLKQSNQVTDKGQWTRNHQTMRAQDCGKILPYIIADGSARETSHLISALSSQRQFD